MQLEIEPVQLCYVHEVSKKVFRGNYLALLVACGGTARIQTPTSCELLRQFAVRKRVDLSSHYFLFVPLRFGSDRNRPMA